MQTATEIMNSWIRLEHALVCWLSYKGYLKQNVSEILQQNLGNLVRGKKYMKIRKMRKKRSGQCPKAIYSSRSGGLTKNLWEKKINVGSRQTCQSFVAV